VKGLARHSQATLSIVPSLPRVSGMVIFREPVASFCGRQGVPPNSIRILLRERFVEESDDIFELIAFKRLTSSVPKSCVHTVTTLLPPTHLGATFPFTTCEVMRSQATAWLGSFLKSTCTSDYTSTSGWAAHNRASGDRAYTVPHKQDVEAIRDHLREVEQAGKQLLQLVSAQLGGTLCRRPSLELSRVPAATRGVRPQPSAGASQASAGSYT